MSNPSLEQVLQQMHAQLQTQQAQQAQLMSAMQSLEQRVSAQNGASSSPPTHVPTLQQAPAEPAQPRAPYTPAPRIPPPDKYAGESTRLDEWLAEIDRQIAWYQFASDTEALRFATQFLRDSAWDWWAHLAQKPSTYASFATALRTRFQPVTAAESARAKLLKLTQSGEYTDVNKYVARFRTLLVSVPSMHADDQLFQFMRGLRPNIAAQLDAVGVATMEEAIERATRIGTRGEIYARTGASTSGGAPGGAAAMDVSNVEGLEHETGAEGVNHASTQGGAGAPITRDDLRELLNAMREERKGPSQRGRGGSRGRGGRRPLPVVPHLTGDQVQQYMAEGKCFGCGSKEHQSRECPKRRVDANGRVSWSN